MCRFLAFRGAGSPAEFVKVTVGLLVLAPVAATIIALTNNDDYPNWVRVIGGTSAAVGVLVWPWVWLSALIRHFRMLRLHWGSASTWKASHCSRFVTLRGVGHPAEFVVITVIMGIFSPPALVLVGLMTWENYAQSWQHTPGQVLFYTGIVAVPWLWLASMVRHIRWLHDLKRGDASHTAKRSEVIVANISSQGR